MEDLERLLHKQKLMYVLTPTKEESILSFVALNAGQARQGWPLLAKASMNECIFVCSDP